MRACAERACNAQAAIKSSGPCVSAHNIISPAAIMVAFKYLCAHARAYAEAGGVGDDDGAPAREREREGRRKKESAAARAHVCPGFSTHARWSAAYTTHTPVIINYFFV